MRVIDTIVLHCSASNDDADIGAKEIKYLHTAPKTEKIDWYGYKTNGRQWSDIGYHYVIRRNGKTELGRPLYRIGAGVKGRNKGAVHICWIGNSLMTTEARRTAIYIISGLCSVHDINIDNVKGHYELAAGKTCPNIDMNAFRNQLKNYMISLDKK